ncbi:NAD-dependent epimerase/dehydratase family protein [Sphingomonas sp. CGMCC 1.13654]|uniref:NAD-dependent epimerase/dehydratase family protein n=1 Tax=Sphingomonas chungangi TaxID=2683589 RepID=A0A838L4S0_9SPHN|nr:NAD-dependent epimerase/dehydratase family protein [Sphingomonas chungangi]MBA2933900.1 NAD-dependent epimerase/dehydratase family protein [Sphingomonas chungangi]MVW55229.1 NAD-dependent epimerase/dehydratase family protein [Sphingomonas chungangi]
MPNALVIGATGFVGGRIAHHLAEHGWAVSGLARSASAIAQLEKSGIDAVAGDVEFDLDAVVTASREHDVVIYAAQIAPPVELVAVSGLISGLTGSGRTFVLLSGSGVLCQRTAGAWSADSFAEDDAFLPEPLAEPRVEAERLVRAASSNGLRTMVVRPPLIWGPGDHGHVPMVYRSVSATGSACYVGNGLAGYGHVHVDDVAALFLRAIEAGKPGTLYHGVAGELPNRWIAEAVARDLGVPTRSVSMEKAAEIWGEFGALIMSVSSRIRDAATRAALGWVPRHTDMLSEIGEPRLRALAASITTKE